jgi:hypothetical protein
MPGKRKRVKLYTRDDCKTWQFAEYVNARSGVEFAVTLDRHFIGTSKRGLPWECLLSKAIERAHTENPGLFDHPVIHPAYVIGMQVYIITAYPKRGNQLPQTVRYDHNFTAKLRKFDKFTKRTFIKHFGDEGCIVRLRPPRADAQRPHGERSATPSRRDKSRTRVLNGALRRAHDAGLILPGAA